MKNTLIRWSKRKHAPKKRLIFLIPAAFFFLVIVPYLFFLISKTVGTLLNLSVISLNPITLVLGIFVSFIGFSLALWTVVYQFIQGKGTPIPMIPTQKLLTSGPYAYSRNPMALGTSVYYIGIGIAIGSIPFVIIAILFGILLFLYIKAVEEKELEERFGTEYKIYKEHTPFLFSIRRKKKDNR